MTKALAPHAPVHSVHAACVPRKISPAPFEETRRWQVVLFDNTTTREREFVYSSYRAKQMHARFIHALIAGMRWKMA